MHPSLCADDVHVWSIPLSLAEEQLRRFRDILSAEERSRADRFAHRLSRNQFVAARASLRLVLARYLGSTTMRIRFEHSSTGKPYLPSRPLYFNVTHSGELALIAVTRNREVGVDVERVRPISAYLDMASRYFSPGEAKALMALPGAASAEAFFHVWTRKEAFLKALGMGLSHGLERFEVSVPPDDPARILHIDGDRQAGSRWLLSAMFPGPGYVAALAIEGREMKISHHVLQHDVPVLATGLV